MRRIPIRTLCRFLPWLILIAFIILPIGIFMGWINISESVRHVDLTVTWDCNSHANDVVYSKYSIFAEVLKCLNNTKILDANVLDESSKIVIATLAPTTFRGVKIGEKWIVFEVRCSNRTDMWRQVVEVDKELLSKQVIRLTCPCHEDEIVREEWKRVRLLSKEPST